MNSFTPQEAVQSSALRHIAFIMDGNGRWATEVGTTMRFIGDIEGLPPKLVSDMLALETETAGNPYVLQIALNYGGRADIVHAVNALIAEGKTSVTEDDITAHLYTAGQPAPDLIVRTAGEMRLSNFLLWQCAYAELYYTDKYWPAMTTADVDEAVYNFAHRKRRFGGLDKPQPSQKENAL